MKTEKELQKILSGGKITDAHVHTHLCDGADDMTVENIGKCAERSGVGNVILTPHFHKSVSDESDTLFTDSDESIFSPCGRRSVIMKKTAER